MALRATPPDVASLQDYFGRCLPPAGAPMRANEPIGPSRDVAVFRHRHHAGEIVVEGYDEGRPPRIQIAVHDYVAVEPQLNRLIKRDWGYYSDVTVQPHHQQSKTDTLQALASQAASSGDPPPNRAPTKRRGPRDPVMRLIWEEAEKRDHRPTPNEMIEWARGPGRISQVPNPAAIGMMLHRHWSNTIQQNRT
jgi:hypothetical protein